MKASPPSGYSGKTLADKLGLQQQMNAVVKNEPTDYFTWLHKKKDELSLSYEPPYDFVHLFVNTISELEDQLWYFRNQIKSNGMIWVSWYKKSSGMASGLTEDIIRDTASAMGLVDIKVGAVSGEWSGLKLVIRKSLR